MSDLLIETDVYGIPMLVSADVRWVEYEYDTNWGGWWQVESVDVFPDGVRSIRVDAAELDRLTTLAEGLAQGMAPPEPYYDD